MKAEISLIKEINTDKDLRQMKNDQVVGNNSYAGAALRAIHDNQNKQVNSGNIVNSSLINNDLRAGTSEKKKEIVLGTARSSNITSIKKHPNKAAIFISRLEPNTKVEDLERELADLKLNFLECS